MLDRAFEHPLELEENATMPFAAGIMQHGYQCGMIWGATLAAYLREGGCSGLMEVLAGE